MGQHFLRRSIISAAALACALAACEYQITGYPPQPPMTTPTQVTDASVHVHWMSGVDEVAKHCTPDGKIDYACARWSLYGEASICDVYVVKPIDFNDEPKLATLGHEFYHCLGAEHGIKP